MNEKLKEIIAIASFRQMRKILKDGCIRRVYLKEDGIIRLAYYILFIPEQERYLVFYCCDGLERSYNEDSLLSDPVLGLNENILTKRILLEN